MNNKTIIYNEIGGTMPEDMATPDKSLKGLEKERNLLENK